MSRTAPDIHVIHSRAIAFGALRDSRSVTASILQADDGKRGKPPELRKACVGSKQRRRKEAEAGSGGPRPSADDGATLRRRPVGRSNEAGQAPGVKHLRMFGHGVIQAERAGLALSPASVRLREAGSTRCGGPRFAATRVGDAKAARSQGRCAGAKPADARCRGLPPVSSGPSEPDAACCPQGRRAGRRRAKGSVQRPAARTGHAADHGKARLVPHRTGKRMRSAATGGRQRCRSLFAFAGSIAGRGPRRFVSCPVPQSVASPPTAARSRCLADSGR